MSKPFNLHQVMRIIGEIEDFSTQYFTDIDELLKEKEQGIEDPEIETKMFQVLRCFNDGVTFQLDKVRQIIE